MKLQKNKIIAFVPLLISLVIIVLIILPSWQRIEEKKSTIEENRITQYDIEQLSQRTVDLKTRTSELSNKLVYLNDKFIDPSRALDFITDIEDLASFSGVEIDVRTFDQPDDKTNEGNLDLRITGDITKVTRFLHSFERMSWLVQINEISINKAVSTSREVGGPNQAADISLDITGQVFWNSL